MTALLRLLGIVAFAWLLVAVVVVLVLTGNAWIVLLAAVLVIAGVVRR